MNQTPLLETISTKYLVITIALVIILIPVSFIVVLRLGISNIDTLATFVDAVFKTIALLIGAIWALNRFFSTRTDATQIRVDDEVSCIPASRFSASQTTQRALLVYRLDIVNTGKTLIEPFQQYVEVQAVVPSQESIDYMTIWRWPVDGMHPGGPIEPGSWSAINDTVGIPPSVQAVRVYLGIQLNQNHFWSWHKTFDVSATSR
jgi:hypothetical protein